MFSLSKLPNYSYLNKLDSREEYLKPIVSELNLGLESVGLKIEEANCSFTAGSTLVRFVAAEQEILEKGVTGEVSGGVR